MYDMPDFIHRLGQRIRANGPEQCGYTADLVPGFPTMHQAIQLSIRVDGHWMNVTVNIDGDTYECYQWSGVPDVQVAARAGQGEEQGNE